MGDRPDTKPLPTHRITQHRKAQTHIHASSGIQIHDPMFQQPKTVQASDCSAIVTSKMNSLFGKIWFMYSQNKCVTVPRTILYNQLESSLFLKVSVSSSMTISCTCTSIYDVLYIWCGVMCNNHNFGIEMYIDAACNNTHLMWKLW
jgi:hypothetical protein